MPDVARPWIDAWHDALYGPAGFYRRGEGPAGHFATSAQGIPGVSEILAQAIVAYAEQCQAEVIVDFACGRGELLETSRELVSPQTALVGVDVVERPDSLADRIGWVRSTGGATVPDLGFLAGRRALIVAHEWLDVVPCSIAEADDDGILRTVLVAPDGAESLGDPLNEADHAWALRQAQHGKPEGARGDVGERSGTSLASDQRQAWEPGQRVECGGARDLAWKDLCEAVRGGGAAGSVVLGIDYGHTAATMPAFGTLTGFRHGSECLPVPDGTCDLTSHVLIDSLDLTAPPSTQRDVLLDLFGETPLQPVPLDLASSNPPAYLERLALRSAFAAATAPNGLGGFFWFVQKV